MTAARLGFLRWLFAAVTVALGVVSVVAYARSGDGGDGGLLGWLSLVALALTLATSFAHQRATGKRPPRQAR